MSSNVCRQCGRPADPFRDHVHVVGMRVEYVCRSCAGGAPVTTSSVKPVASRPQPAPVHEPAPPTAPPTKASPPTRAAAKPVARTQPGRKEAIALVAVLIVAAASVSVALAIRARRNRSAEAAPVPEATPDAGPAPIATGKKGFTIRTISDGNESSESQAPPVGLQAVLEGKWTHPLVGPFRELPPNETTRFGAYRSREVYKHMYCGSGHCGNDLGNKVGLPIVSVRDGVLERVERRPSEVEGKWIKIRHPGGLHSYYMHLDQVAPGLEVGGQVTRGQHIGTLGTTGIKRSEAHLHFMISFDAPTGTLGKELFIDPEPIVREADLVEINEIPAWALPSGE
jgi:murein DD-endopeptidase MepM/ murein hydrolase activator NlpD